MTRRPSRQRVYDHRLRKLVWETGNPELFPDLAIPRSTLAGWLKEPPREVVTIDWLVHSEVSPLLTLHMTEKRNAILVALLRLQLSPDFANPTHREGDRDDSRDGDLRRLPAYVAELPGSVRLARG